MQATIEREIIRTFLQFSASFCRLLIMSSAKIVDSNVLVSSMINFM